MNTTFAHFIYILVILLCNLFLFYILRRKEKINNNFIWFFAIAVFIITFIHTPLLNIKVLMPSRDFFSLFKLSIALVIFNFVGDWILKFVREQMMGRMSENAIFLINKLTTIVFHRGIYVFVSILQIMVIVSTIW
jgi:hypothetical protein